MRWEAVFWDFDGVVLDSMNVKTHAFARMFRQYGPSIEKAVIDYHLANGGISRYEKFKYFYRELLKKPLSDLELSDLGEKFSELTLDEILNTPFIAGALETLENLKKTEVPCYVASGVPDEEIKQIVKTRNIDHFFREVHGSPREKHQIISDILTRYNYASQRCLFLGDAMSDYKAAQTTKVTFLGIVSANNPSPFPEDTATSRVVTADLPGRKS